MKKKYSVKKTDVLPPLKETLKQKIQLKALRIRTKFYRKNNVFKIVKKKIYTELGNLPFRTQ